MAVQWLLESTTAPGLEFKIVKLDKPTMRATLQGDTGVPFDRSITQEELDKWGYRIVRREVQEQAA